ncbi:argininosuccinate lyase [Pontiella agarivorans]|uniref:Argininosuccinate lyase n=1 Tax=Pontiella agarivorans TaxID=3038953 RepID=A0ABU5MXV8_9BACT|nr:argininosuccinate lyase [Pontiella agarivorans]MDZ8118997.1 argininosuccinate lyase [Pontiella agarivorans]
MAKQKTTVGIINNETLAYTAGRDVELDHALITVDCIGTAAHVTMLSKMPVQPKLITEDERKRVIEGLVEIIGQAQRNKFKIQLADQDVHLAVERTLTKKLGDLGKKIHTCRSRNDQVAVDLRLYAKEQLLQTLDEAAALAAALVSFGRKNKMVPMVGRTHMQPGMPSSVGLWATAHAESLLDDCVGLINAYELNDQCPLGSAASYGVPLPIDRQLTSDLLGFGRPTHNVLYANNGRGKMENLVLSAMSQVMLTLSRLSQDLMIFTMPEFDYFQLPAEFCTGSSIMPQKQNPDVCELMRAKASRVKAAELGVYDLIKGSPTGYNRDLQEAKELFMEGIATTRASLRIMTPMIQGTKANKKKLIAGFTPDVFATDRALELVGEGMPFRDAYHYIKENLHELENIDPTEAILLKTHMGAPLGLDWEYFKGRIAAVKETVREERKAFNRAVSKLLGVKYPLK